MCGHLSTRPLPLLLVFLTYSQKQVPAKSWIHVLHMWFHAPLRSPVDCIPVIFARPDFRHSQHSPTCPRQHLHCLSRTKEHTKVLFTNMRHARIAPRGSPEIDRHVFNRVPKVRRCGLYCPKTNLFYIVVTVTLSGSTYNWAPGHNPPVGPSHARGAGVAIGADGSCATSMPKYVYL